ncbi:MAG: hypothetical protein Q4G65_17960 [bacterium]|nr:hypothetical protein [bacterium]
MLKVSLLVVLLLCGVTLADTTPLPRSLVSRMLDARENFIAPKKSMCLEVDAGADTTKWPFDVARIERMLEKVLDRAEDGSYRLKREDDGANDNLRERSANALAYVNKVIADWSVMQLDGKFERCDAKTVMALAGYRVDLDPNFWHAFAILTKKGLFGGGSAKVGGWISAWKVSDRLYLVLTSELSTEGRPRDYQFVRWDGKKDWPIAGFEEFPDAVRALTVMRVTESPIAANNLAALVHAREANRRLYMPEYVEQLLRRSAAGGCEKAFHNLGVLMEEQGDVEQAKAFFSREQK